ncbi:HAD family hydrolase [Ruminococcus sp. 5_1_39BFAA]|uniref:HAD family hydrolase n=1 Tax=Ruminococcus sp. 5_1_39BFAA TaxID=457412 RepID=UPI003563A72D
MKQYKAIFFDWDGTAVLSRKAPADEAAAAMKPLLAQGTKLAVVSGTTMENIAGGRLASYFTVEERKNLFFGLGRGAFNYGFDEKGELISIGGRMPDPETLLYIHDACYDIHRFLLEKYSMNTDVVFSRPNYCKIDLMAERDRGDALFLQEGEVERLMESLAAHGFAGGLKKLIALAESRSREGFPPLTATTDAKYLEVGISSKSDNVNTLMGYFAENHGITSVDCCFWGDEFIGLGEGVYGSDSFMITPETVGGDFFDVSEAAGSRPDKVKLVGGGVKEFLRFLTCQKRKIFS